MAPRWNTMAITGWSFGFGCLAMVGVSAVQERMEIRGNIKLLGDGSGLIFPDGSKQITAVATDTEPYVLGNDSVDSQHYVDGSIDGVHLADGQVASADIADGTIVSADIADGTIVQADLSAVLHNTYNDGITTNAGNIATNTTSIASVGQIGAVNTGIGYQVLLNDPGDRYSTAIGYQALYNSTAHYNTAIGYKTLYNNTGQGNTASGWWALYDSTTGHSNTAHGSAALHNNTEGDYNTATGAEAGALVTTGSNNTMIGYQADPSANNATNQIVIGYRATGLGNNYAVIGNADVERLYAAQDGAGVLYANGTIESSDRRIKKDITDLAVGLDYVRRLRPVRYLKKHPNEYPQDLQDKFYPDGQLRKIHGADYDTPQVGFIAQEVQAVNAHFGVKNNIITIDEDGFHRMDYEKLIAPVVRGVQELDTVVQELKATLQQHDAVIAAQQAQLEAVMARLAALEQQLTE